VLLAWISAARDCRGLRWEVAVDERWVRKALRASAVCWGSVEEGGVDVVAGGSEEGLEEATVGEEDILGN